MLVRQVGEERTRVEVLSWPAFRTWWAGAWAQGEHVALIAPTGAGKSTCGIGLVGVSKYVAALDPKGGDRTLDATGWPRVTKWPLPLRIREAVAQREPVRIIIGIKARTAARRAANRRLLALAVPGLWEQGNWTVVVDETQLLTDQRFHGLGDDVVEMLIAARDRGLSVVSALQRVSIGQTTGGASGTVGDQSTWVAVSYTRDDRMVQRLAELLGRPASECRDLIRAIPLHAWAMVGRDPREPFRLFRPPKVEPLPPEGDGAPVISWRDRVHLI